MMAPPNDYQQDVNFWFQSRSFFNFVTSTLSATDLEERTSSEFETELNKFHSSLLNLLKNSPKSSADRQRLQNAGRNQENIALSSGNFQSPRRGTIQVDERLVNEALIISDLFDLNELEALELVLAGQEETANYPELARGLCAVMCYYNSHNFILQSLKCLLMARNGRFWHYDTLESLRAVTLNFTNKLWKEGNRLLGILLDAISDVDLSKELERLQQPTVKGLGNSRHRKLVSDLISGIYNTISECVLVWCCQNPLTTVEFERLSVYVRNMDLKYGFRRIEGNMLCAFLYAFDATLLESVDNKTDLELCPFAASESSLNSYQKSICDGSYKNGGIQSLVLWAWAVSLRMTAQHHIAEKTMENFEQDEEELIDGAIEKESFNNHVILFENSDTLCFKKETGSVQQF